MNKKKMLILAAALLVIFGLGAFAYASFTEAEYTVSFNSNGGSPVEAIKVKSGSKVTKPADPTKEDYEFVGWYLSLKDEEAYDFSKAVTRNFTLIAKWNSVVDETQKDVCNLTCEDGFELDSENCECIEISDESDDYISLNIGNVTLTIGESVTARATIAIEDAVGKTITWSSSNPKVATVVNGKITALASGTTRITATVDGKSTSITITVKANGSKEDKPEKNDPDAENLAEALKSMTSKTISEIGTDLNYSFDGCTIENTANQINSVTSPTGAKTTIEKGTVRTLYRGVSDGSVTSTYKVTCGTVTGSKTVTHTIQSSTYGYTAEKTPMTWNFRIDGATDYTMYISGTAVSYLPTMKAVQTGLIHIVGTTYDMMFKNDENTVYAVRSLEN